MKPISKTQVLEQVLALSRQECEELLSDILESLEEPTPEEHQELWGEVARCRYNDLKSGKVKGIPYEEVLRNVKSR
jgi:putative addiction module component (TIGR02574 family)